MIMSCLSPLKDVYSKVVRLTFVIGLYVSPFCYSNVLMYASLKLCALRDVNEKENIGNYYFST